MKKVILTILLLFLFSFTFAQTTYSQSELQEAITWMYSKGLTSKSTVTDYLPSNTMTREEASKFFSVFAKTIYDIPQDLTASCSFYDIKKADPTLTSSIINACKLGIFKGYQGNFTPLDKLTNAQAITVLIRIMVGTLSEPTKAFYANYLLKAKEFSLIENVSVNTNITRGEAAILLYKANTYREKNNIITPVDTTNDNSNAYNDSDTDAICTTPQTILSCSLGLATCPDICLDEFTYSTTTTPSSTITPVSNTTTPAPTVCTGLALTLLQEKYPIGYSIYQKMTDKNTFYAFLSCPLPNYSVEVAVHESLHSIDGSMFSGGKLIAKYYQPNGTTLYMTNKKLFFRKDIVNYLDAVDKQSGYVPIYLEGPSGNQDIITLLDELSAYTYSLEIAKALYNSSSNSRSSYRDGLASFMYYTTLYLKSARIDHPLDREKIYSDPQYLNVIQTLRSRAESVFQLGLGIDKLGINDAPIIQKVYDNIDELTTTFEMGGSTFIYTQPTL